MTNDEADDWLAKNGSYRTVRAVEMTVYEVHRKAGTNGEEEVVGFGVPDGVPPPRLDDVRRFLTRWFVDAYGV